MFKGAQGLGFTAGYFASLATRLQGLPGCSSALLSLEKYSRYPGKKTLRSRAGAGSMWEFLHSEVSASSHQLTNPAAGRVGHYCSAQDPVLERQPENAAATRQ